MAMNYETLRAVQRAMINNAGTRAIKIERDLRVHGEPLLREVGRRLTASRCVAVYTFYILACLCFDGSVTCTARVLKIRSAPLRGELDFVIYLSRLCDEPVVHVIICYFQMDKCIFLQYRNH